MKRISVVGICGSMRTGSLNRKLLNVVMAHAAAAGVDTSEIDLKSLDLPLYNGDIEAAGMPAHVHELKSRIVAADVILIVSPEYNHSIPGVLKNAIDWASRGGNSFKGKCAAIFGATPGLYGTLRCQLQLRTVLAALGVHLLPQPQVFLGRADQAFADDGSLKDSDLDAQVRTLVEKTVTLAQKLA